MGASCERACEQIASEAVRRFKSSQYEDAETMQIMLDFEEKGKILQRPTQKVGLVGDSGVGKSLNVIIVFTKY